MIAADRAARRVIFAALRRLEGGRLTIVEGARRTTFGVDRADSYGRAPVDCVIRVNDRRVYRRVLRESSVGLGVSFAEGWWETDDLTETLRLLSRNVRRADPLLGRIRSLTGPVADPIRALRPADRERDRINIGAHYDQGNEFFALFLDPTMMYSCAIFPHSASTLEEASVEKLEQICRRAQLSAEDHVLEIGTGWGGFAVHAASLYGCRVTTTTISREQYEFATERVREAGLEDLVTVLFEHYRDLDGQFDKLVSIEMIEAVDWREYDDFFASCARLLKPNGLCTLQAITVPGQRFERSKNVQDFIKAVIFPGGCLPSVEAILSSTARATDFDLIDLDDIGLHYAETLRRWRSALLANRDKLEQLGFDDVAARVWEFYFCYCEAGFDERVISDVQLVLARPGFVASSSPEGP